MTESSNSIDWPNCETPLDAVTEDNQILEDQIVQILDSMSLEQKAGQMIQAEINSITPQAAGDHAIGSILNGGGSFPFGNKHASVSDWLELADSFHRESLNRAGHAVPIIWATDAVHGHNNVYTATMFPHNIGLGATRNFDLMREIAAATARDVVATGIAWTFAPTMAVPLDLRWGRSYEGFSEDPTVVARCAEAVIVGLQGTVSESSFLSGDKVLATSKHFVGEGGTTNGQDQGDTICGEAELRHVHSLGHVAALRAGAQVVMAAFNSWNGHRLHAHRYLLTDVLKGDIGFSGFVVSDWDGFSHVHTDLTRAIVDSVNAGVDMLMVSEGWNDVLNRLVRSIQSGEISQERVDDSVRRILRVKARASRLSPQLPSERSQAAMLRTLGSHKSIAQRAVRESLVLLKNEDGTLPIATNARVLVCGDCADDVGRQCGGWSLTWQGTDNTNEDFPHGSTLYDGIRERVENGGGSVELSTTGQYSTRPDIAIVAFGEKPYAEGEGDLADINFSRQFSEPLQVLRRLRADNIPTVSVLFTGRPLWVNPELNASSSFVVAWLPGTEGSAMADVLFADSDGTRRFDFAGRLSFSWPRRANQARFEDRERDPLFALGYGLSVSESPELGQLSEEEQDGDS